MKEKIDLASCLFFEKFWLLKLFKIEWSLKEAHLTEILYRYVQLQRICFFKETPTALKRIKNPVEKYWVSVC